MVFHKFLLLLHFLSLKESKHNNSQFLIFTCRLQQTWQKKICDLTEKISDLCISKVFVGVVKRCLSAIAFTQLESLWSKLRSKSLNSKSIQSKIFCSKSLHPLHFCEHDFKFLERKFYLTEFPIFPFIPVEFLNGFFWTNHFSLFNFLLAPLIIIWSEFKVSLF